MKKHSIIILIYCLLSVYWDLPARFQTKPFIRCQLYSFTRRTVTMINEVFFTNYFVYSVLMTNKPFIESFLFCFNRIGISLAYRGLAAD